MRLYHRYMLFLDTWARHCQEREHTTYRQRLEMMGTSDEEGSEDASMESDDDMDD